MTEDEAKTSNYGTMLTLADCKADYRPKRGSWAPGSYLNRCCTCKSGFIGDKRALECADCAYDPMTYEAKTEG